MTTTNHGIEYVPEGTLDPAAGLNLALLQVDALIGRTVPVTGTTRATAPADAGGVLRCTNAGAVIVTVAAGAYPDAALLTVRAVGAGGVTLVAGAGVTLNALSMAVAQHRTALLRHAGGDVWDVSVI
jgi:hypothetical protein